MSLSVDEIQMKATEQYFPVVLFITLNKVVPTFDSVDEILKDLNCEHSNESYWADLSLVLFTMLYTVVSTFESVSEILNSHH